MKNKTLTVPVLNDEYSVAVILSNDKKYTHRTMKKYGYDDVDFHDMSIWMDDSSGLTYHKTGGNPRPLISIMVKKDPFGIGVLAHEAVHAVKYIFDYIQEDNLHEAFAHSVEAVVRKVLEEW